MTKRIINIRGMHCNHCKMTIEKNIQDLEGVDQVEVSLKNKIAIVDYNEDVISIMEIKRVIDESGYQAI